MSAHEAPNSAILIQDREAIVFGLLQNLNDLLDSGLEGQPLDILGHYLFRD